MKLVRQHFLVVLLLTLLASEVHLLDELATVVSFFDHGDVFTDRRVLALGGATLLDRVPPLLKHVVPLLQLLLVLRLPLLHLHQLLVFLLVIKLFQQGVLLCLRLFLVFNLFALHGVLFKLADIVVLLLLYLELQLFVDSVRHPVHRLLEFLLLLEFEFICVLELHLDFLDPRLDLLDLFDVTNHFEMSGPARRGKSSDFCAICRLPHLGSVILVEADLASKSVVADWLTLLI